MYFRKFCPKQSQGFKPSAAHPQVLVEYPLPPPLVEHMAKNQFQMHILWFFFHTDVKM